MFGWCNSQTAACRFQRTGGGGGGGLKRRDAGGVGGWGGGGVGEGGGRLVDSPFLFRELWGLAQESLDASSSPAREVKRSQYDAGGGVRPCLKTGGFKSAVLGAGSCRGLRGS